MPLSYNIALTSNLYADYFPSLGLLHAVCTEVGIHEQYHHFRLYRTPGNMQQSKLMQTFSLGSDLISPHCNCCFQLDRGQQTMLRSNRPLIDSAKKVFLGIFFCYSIAVNGRANYMTLFIDLRKICSFSMSSIRY